eukprot:TRINITY_DN14444_c0_g1_i1.p1 TRINITY_DN14444_c0_g1~~TRINITY_DN14444_c0_g1_i1.p1  ORF type:complete len:251 (+),score=17.56 TRINITY_DN14444_c0_g1_i1:1-753(+)
MDSDDNLSGVLLVLNVIFGVIYYLSNLPTILKFSNLKKIKPKDYSYYPYLFQFINSTTIIIYTIVSYLLEIEKEEYIISLFITNVIGVITSSYYLTKYHEFCSKSQRENMIDEFNYSIGYILFLAFISSFFIMNEPSYHVLLRTCASISYVGMFASTSFNLKNFILKQKINLMPRNMIFTGSVYSCLLFVYTSYYIDELKIYLPYVMGYTMCCIQLASVLVFPYFFDFKKKKDLEINNNENFAKIEKKNY